MKESTSISMVVDKWKEGQVEQCSLVQRINGYPWRLRLFQYDRERRFEVICDKSTEAELWWCIATIKSSTHESYMRVHFMSWYKGSQSKRFYYRRITEGMRLEVDIVTEFDGATMRTRPILDPFKQRNGIIVTDGVNIHVDKKSLASQSPFFDRLFFGSFKEKKMRKVPLGDVQAEEFSNLLKLIYRLDGASLSGYYFNFFKYNNVPDENVHRVLELVDRYDLKIVEDRVVSFLLSEYSLISIHKKLLMSEQYNISFLKEQIISRYSVRLLGELSKSTVWDQLSKETIKAIAKRYCCDDDPYSATSEPDC
ncbi:hypothetical protein PRIPAC_94709 [Pristionchus pacificus]|nr:hypothetical protein PRIPAC_94709 [Pristionchus pacificus]